MTITDKIPLIFDEGDADDEEDYPSLSLKSRQQAASFRQFLIFLTSILFVLLIIVSSILIWTLWSPCSCQYEPKLEKITEPFFPKLDLTKDLQCGNYFVNITPFPKKIVINDTPELTTKISMKCNDILKRHYFPSFPLNEDEATFPLAFARNVFSDYYFLEMELASIYAPQNYYCFSIDKHAKPEFHQQIHALSSCFSNVFYTVTEYLLDSAGHNQNAAHYDCINIMKSYPWKYIVLLQNHDVAMKTNGQMIQIFKWFNGANDISANPIISHRVNQTLDWSFKGLNLFKNATRNTMKYNGFEPRMKFSKTLVECALSKAMVNFMFKELDLTTTIKYFNVGGYGTDEYFFSSIHTTDAIGMPGGFTQKCLNESIGTTDTIRKNDWIWSNSDKTCKGGLLRHSICIYSIEDLPRVPGSREMFLNKMVPTMDFGSFYCLKQRVFNETYGIKDTPVPTVLKADTYLNLLHIRYHRERQKPGFKLENFKCK